MSDTIDGVTRPVPDAPVTRVELLDALCRELVRMARHEEDAAATEASRTPYWVACPPSVEGHRAAARALWADLARLEGQARSLTRDLALAS